MNLEEDNVDPGPPGVDPPPPGSVPRWAPPQQQPFAGWQQPFAGWQQPMMTFPWWQQPGGGYPWQQTGGMQHADGAASVSLPNFWTKDPAAWFRLAEAAFGRKNITEGNHQFDLCLRFLSEDTIERVRDVLRMADRLENPFITLKEELIRLYAPNVLEQLNGIIFAPELGGQPPSQLMNHMLSLLPAGEPPGLLFKHHFILRLPSDIRDQVAKKLEKLSAKELAE